MKRWSRVAKDRCAAVLLALLGAAAIVAGAGYRIGSLTRMGSGFVPVTLGVVLLILSLGLALATLSPGAQGEPYEPPPGVRVDAPVLQWRGWGCIIGGLLAFFWVGEHGGLVPATFASVFIAALGDRENRMLDAALLAVAMVVVAIVVFGWGLKLQLPLLRWSW